jgi:hypothetical protein
MGFGEGLPGVWEGLWTGGSEGGLVEGGVEGRKGRLGAGEAPVGIDPGGAGIEGSAHGVLVSEGDAASEGSAEVGEGGSGVLFLSEEVVGGDEKSEGGVLLCIEERAAELANVGDGLGGAGKPRLRIEAGEGCAFGGAGVYEKIINIALWKLAVDYFALRIVGVCFLDQILKR